MRLTSPLLPRTHRGIAAILALVFGLPSLFLFAHPYTGIQHDGFLYSLQALRQLYPASLGGDLFFRYGSQDAYTIFSGLYATLIRGLGLEPAARLLTHLSSIAEIIAALLIARRVMGGRIAWLALALFIVLPGKYGANNVFRYGEPFVSARTPAEALGLLAVALALGERWWWSAGCVALAALFHPLMALPALLVVALLYLRDARWWIAAFCAGTAAVAGAMALAVWAPMGPLRLIDPEWRRFLEAALPYLLANKWSIVDWQRAVVPLVTLAITALMWRRDSAARLATAALGVGAAGLALTLLASSLAPIAMLVQGQPWRWMWIAKAAAVLLLAPLGAALWRRGAGGRATLALLAVAWCSGDDGLGLAAGMVAGLCAMLECRDEPPPRLLWIAAAAFAALFALGIMRLSGLPAALIGAGPPILVWWLTFQSGRPTLALAAAIAVAALCALQLQALWTAPPAPDYDLAAAHYLPWQQAIGPQQTVLVAPQPMFAWLALHRRTYLSPAGAVFSRDTSLAVRDRDAAVIAKVGPAAAWFLPTAAPLRAPPPPLSLADLHRLCELQDIDFVIAPQALAAPRRTAPALPGFPENHLYDCGALRGHAPLP